MIRRYTLDLSVSHSDYEVEINAKKIYFTQVDSPCFIKFNEKNADPLPVHTDMFIECEHKIKKVYISNSGGSGQLVFYTSDYLDIRG